MTEPPTVVVLMGGPDAERAVSLDSGRAVAQALRERSEFKVEERVIDRPTALELDAVGGDVIFPVLHGHWGEGGPLQALLEEVGRPYVGSGPQASAMAMNKLTTKEIAQELSIATPQACLVEPTGACDLDPPLVLKPVDDGSSVDLRICRSVEHVDAARHELHPRRGPLLAERYVQGRELTCGIILGEALPIIEIIPAVEFYDYQAKYHRDDTRYLIDPDLTEGVAECCRGASLRVYERLGCRDIARVDFMLDENGLWFLEINTMPGFTSHSLVPMAARHAGVGMPRLCARLVNEALARGSAVHSGGSRPARTPEARTVI